MLATTYDSRAPIATICTLNDMQAGQTGMILSIRNHSPQSRRELEAMGILLHSTVTIVANYPHHVIFTVNQSKIAMDKETASSISLCTLA